MVLICSIRTFCRGTSAASFVAAYASWSWSRSLGFGCVLGWPIKRYDGFVLLELAVLPRFERYEFILFYWAF